MFRHHLHASLLVELVHDVLVHLHLIMRSADHLTAVLSGLADTDDTLRRNLYRGAARDVPLGLVGADEISRPDRRFQEERPVLLGRVASHQER